MSISLPTNKKEKADRLIMLYRQGSISKRQALRAYEDYRRLYDKVKK